MQEADFREITDEELMQAVAEGDLAAFGEIVLRYQRVAWKVAFRVLGDTMEAEDVSQETFLKIFEAAPRYRPTATFRTYFYAILTHLCTDRTRKKQPASLDHSPEGVDPSLGPDEGLIQQERRTQVRKALDALPPNQRVAMILRHYEELSYTEISEVLGVTSKAVEGLIGRARAALQARLCRF